MSEPITYAAAGVDVEAGDRAVELMKDAVARTHVGVPAPVMSGVGGFAGLVDARMLTGYRHPLLATSTDGVGTKIAVARALDVHDTIGIDLVAMVVDDIVVCGARPLFMTDYIACGQVVPHRIAAIVSGIAAGCELARCALVGGETAEHPGLMDPDEYDLAGAVTGVVEADELLGPHRVQAGDVVVAMASSGLHSNGYSLVRRVLQVAGWDYYRHVPELGRTVGEELLEPTRVYAADLVDLLARAPGAVHALSHVTGGGLAANLARVLPPGLRATVERGTWTPPPVFEVVARLGAVPQGDLERTVNLGVGMVAVVASQAADDVLRVLGERGLTAWVAGEVSSEPDRDGRSDDVRQTIVRGAKGVDGGSVAVVGTHPL